MAVACPYCHDEIVDGPPSRCAICSTPHHGDCFEENDGCAVPLCSGGPKLPVLPAPGGGREAAGAGSATGTVGAGTASGGRLMVDLGSEPAPRAGRRWPAAIGPRAGRGRRPWGPALAGVLVLLVGAGVVVVASGDSRSGAPSSRAAAVPVADPDRPFALAAKAMTQDLDQQLLRRVQDPKRQYTTAYQHAQDATLRRQQQTAADNGGGTQNLQGGRGTQNVPGGAGTQNVPGGDSPPSGAAASE